MPLLRHPRTRGVLWSTGPAWKHFERPFVLTDFTGCPAGWCEERRDLSIKVFPSKGTREGPLAEAAQATTWSAQSAPSVLKELKRVLSPCVKSEAFFRHTGVRFLDRCAIVFLFACWPNLHCLLELKISSTELRYEWESHAG